MEQPVQLSPVKSRTDSVAFGRPMTPPSASTSESSRGFSTTGRRQAAAKVASRQGRSRCERFKVQKMQLLARKIQRDNARIRMPQSVDHSARRKRAAKVALYVVQSETDIGRQSGRTL
jgi:hypothetical protein